MKSFLTGVIVLPVLLVVVGCAPTTPTRTAPTTYAQPKVLVDTTWVAAHLSDPQVRLIDLSTKKEVYDQGHLPGAAFVNTADLMAPLTPASGRILPQSQLETRLGRLGIRRDTTIVLYDDMQSLYAARFFWLLKYYSIPNVVILNGGSQRWKQEQRELTKDVPTFATTTYALNPATPATLPFRPSWDYIAASLKKASVALVDVRSVAEFTGEQVRGARGGHIPGAVNVEWSQAMAPDNTFRSPAELSRLYQRAGITGEQEIITYCQTGTRGAHTWFVLKYLLGFTNVSLYEGSWEEWSGRAELPVAVGANTPASQAAPLKTPAPCE